MNKETKKALIFELMHSLKASWVHVSRNVSCDTGKSEYILDIALHTNEFIYGCITVGPTNSALERFGIDCKSCNLIEDIDDCVTWAISLQEKHMRSQAVRMVA